MDLVSLVFLPLKAAFSAAMLYGFYRFVLRKEQHFGANRTFLLLSMLVSIIIPFITITIIQNVVMHEVAPSVAVLESSQSMGVTPIILEQSLSLSEMVGIVYLAITGCMLLRLLLILLQFVLSVSRNSRRETVNGKVVLISNAYPQTFSFFGIVVMAENDFKRADRHLLIAHEQVHARQLHSLDLLVAELFIVFQWFNPISYLLRDSLHEVHEYLADRCVIQGGADQLSYKRLLLDCITAANMPTLSSSFSAKLSKRRFAMISKKYNKGNRRYKFLLSIPIAVVLFAMFSLKVEANYVYAKEKGFNPSKIITSIEKVVVGSENPKQQQSVEFTERVTELVEPISLMNQSLRLQVEEPAINFRSSEKLQQITTQELIQICNKSVPGGGFLKDFSFEKLQPTELRKHSLVLTGGNTYCIASSSDANISTPTTLTLYTTDVNGIITEIKSKIEVDGKVTKQMYDIKTTAVYHLTVTNGLSKPFNMGAVLFFMGQFELNQPEMKAPSEVVDDEVFSIVENMPEFEGKGIEHARSYLQKQLKYPEAAKANGIKGNVYVSFVVNSEGKVENVKIARSLEPSLDKEAVRVVSEMPKWTPGKQRGKAVNVAFIVPIIFQ
ncbi:TonB family protein [Williamwhitmania taraxaci]|uniref:TonB family C-terminal domain-containing protein n=1 Tax=Williamwhitmania taraxaci TaxID=1640674 RepID=A0A1G6MYE2_9BACT|nr:M56 family metallopeptidase [Williamwhitmania taraxaci]SDC60006.1 TonB family C-terminal domain-containing protein [Williamwhitmania taraxaci]